MSDYTYEYYFSESAKHEENGNMRDAIANAIKGCKVYNIPEHDRILGYANVARLYSKIYDVKNAYLWINKANERMDEGEYLNEQNTFICLKDIATVYTKFNDYHKAKEYFERIKDIEVEDSSKMYFYNNYAICLINLHEYQKAINYLDYYLTLVITIHNNKIKEIDNRVINTDQIPQGSNTLTYRIKVNQKKREEKERIDNIYNTKLYIGKMIKAETCYKIDKYDEAISLAKECIHYFKQDKKRFIKEYLNTYSRLIRYQLNFGKQTNNQDMLMQAFNNVEKLIPILRTSSNTEVLEDTYKLKRELEYILGTDSKDDISKLISLYRISLLKDCSNDELDMLKFYISFIDYYHRIISQLNQNKKIDLDKYSEMYQQFCIDYFNTKLDTLVKKDYTDLLKSKYLNIEINQGTNNIYLQQISEQITLSNVQSKLKEDLALIDIYQLGSDTYFYLINQNSIQAFNQENEVSDYFAQGQYQKVYVLSDGNYHNRNLESFIPCNFIEITSIYSLFKENLHIIFTAANYGNCIRNNNSVLNLLGAQVENQIFNETFDHCLSFTGYQFNKDNIMNVVSPKVLHISTHGVYYGDNVDKNKRNQLALSCYNENNDLVLLVEDIEKMNLNHTELVFLDTCESGLGDTINGEGIGGFRRAFSKAGVKYIISTLTTINDINATLFCKVFYTKYKEYDDVEKAFFETKSYLKTPEAISELENLSPYCNGLDPVSIKEAIYNAKQYNRIYRYDSQREKYVLEDWSSFILHKC